MYEYYDDFRERLLVIEESLNQVKHEVGGIDNISSRLDSIIETNKDFKDRLVHIEDKENEYFNIGSEQNLEPILDENTDRKLRVHYIRSVDWHNAGDMSCNPYSYFAELKNYHSILHDWKSIDWNLIMPDDIIILGGGGLLNCSDELQNVINLILNKCNNVISWGCGFNTHFGKRLDDNLAINKFAIFTCRDYLPNSNFKYCPDVSCMMEYFDNHFEIKRDIGVIEHLAFPINEFKYEKISNRHALNEVVSFIGESEKIITNSWHCAYWAQLLGKKVVIYKPFSDKFDNFKYKIGFYSGNIMADFDNAQVHDAMLDECRKINIKVMQDVCEYVESKINGGYSE